MMGRRQSSPVRAMRPSRNAADIHPVYQIIENIDQLCHSHGQGHNSGCFGRCFPGKVILRLFFLKFHRNFLLIREVCHLKKSNRRITVL